MGGGKAGYDFRFNEDVDTAAEGEYSSVSSEQKIKFLKDHCGVNLKYTCSCGTVLQYFSFIYEEQLDLNTNLSLNPVLAKVKGWMFAVHKRMTHQFYLGIFSVVHLSTVAAYL